jgi:hypothetical protein
MRKLKKINEHHKAIYEWQLEHPTGRKCECIRELGFSNKTVDKWWNVVFKDPNDLRLTDEEIHNHLKQIKANI